jgi:aldose sugar dehydrogenase
MKKLSNLQGVGLALLVIVVVGVGALYTIIAPRSFDDFRDRLVTGISTRLELEAAPGQPRPYHGELPSMAAVNIRNAVLEEVYAGLDYPWAMEFISERELLITEFGGHLKRLNLDSGELQEISGLPTIAAGRGQAGLMDIALHPQFEQNGLLYFSHAVEDPQRPGFFATAVSRAHYDATQLSDVQRLLVAQPYVDSLSNFGGALLFDLDGLLYVGIGDRTRDLQAQQKNSLNGKILRITDSGEPAPHNPFLEHPRLDPRVYALGVRNPQGLALHPTTGQVYESEHGPMGGDEINLLRPAANYGWPVISYGDNYNTQKKALGTRRDGLQQPLYYYLPSIATSPLAFYQGTMFDEWQNHLLVGPLRPGHVNKLDILNNQVLSEQRVLQEMEGRVRDIKVAGDGSIYFLAENGGRLYRLYRDFDSADLEQVEQRTGATVFRTACAQCHQSKRAGVPQVTRPQDWQLSQKTRQMLYQHALEGYGAMPPKGLCDNCSEAEIRAGVDHILQALKKRGATLSAAPDTRPNFIIMIADDLSWNDLSTYSNGTAATPNIEQLARHGLRYDNAFLTTSSCSASRASILTGRYPQSNGLAHLHEALAADEETLGKLLRDAGYYTAGLGKWHIGSNAKEQFDYVLEDNSETGTGHWIEALRNRPAGRPFFYWLASQDPHRPHTASKGELQYDPANITLPPGFVDGPGTRKKLAQYYAEISRFDRDVGRVIAELEAQGLLQSTLVMVMSDNGRPFFNGKLQLYDDGLKTPLVLSWPGTIPSGETREQLVSAIDLAPTLLELASAPIPEQLQGHSIAASFEDRTADIRPAIYGVRNWHQRNAHERAMRTREFFYKENQHPAQGDCHGDAQFGFSPAFKEFATEFHAGTLPAHVDNCFAPQRDAVELLAVSPDGHLLPGNLAERDEYRQTRQAMATALAQWRASTGDFDYQPVTDPRLNRGAREAQ